VRPQVGLPWACGRGLQNVDEVSADCNAELMGILDANSRVYLISWRSRCPEGHVGFMRAGRTAAAFCCCCCYHVQSCHGEILLNLGRPTPTSNQMSFKPEAIQEKEESMERSEPNGVSQLAGIAMILILVVAGCAIWWLHFRMPVELDPSSIKGISLTLDGWRGQEISLSDGVEKMLRADSQFQRRYLSPDADLVWLYVGYYGTERGGRPEHTPWVCYPSAGWVILSAIEMSPGRDSNEGSGGGGKLNELVVEQGGARRLVHFWYQTHRTKNIATETGLTFDHVLGRLSESGRADGALIRVSTPIGRAGIEPARQRLRDFAAALEPNLRENWPS
jgi:EpsI family protein